MRPVAVLPVKRLESAKTRLAPVLPEPDRREIVLKCFLHAARLCSMLGLEVVALTPDTTIARTSVKNGWSVFPDGGGGLNVELKKFLDACSKKPVLVILPDLPLLSRKSLKTVLSLACGGTPVICPDLRLDGTNILYLTRIRGFTPSYGRRSFSKHLHQLADAKIYVSTETGLDLDRIGDLALLTSSGPAPPSRDKQHGHN